mgnify:CR=1 FL=1
MSLRGKVIVVTGAARGLGQEYAKSFAADGAKVVAADITDCAATLDLVKAAGGEGIAVNLDVTDTASVEAMAAAALKAFGTINGLVNNAALYGSLKPGRFDTLSEDEWDAVMAVNVKGIWKCCKAVVPSMRENGGSIVNVASLAGVFGAPLFLHYTTSKAAVVGLTRGLARELGRDNIRVNAIAPSGVHTEATMEFFGDKYEKAAEQMRRGQTIQRTLEPSDLVGTVSYLLSDASSFVTGQTIMLDGGAVMH